MYGGMLYSGLAQYSEPEKFAGIEIDKVKAKEYLEQAIILLEPACDQETDSYSEQTCTVVTVLPIIIDDFLNTTDSEN